MKKFVVGTFIAIFCNVCTQAQQVYIGGEVGAENWQMSYDNGGSPSTSDASYAAILGYAFNQNWAIESTYFSLGKYSSTLNEFADSYKVTGVDLAGVFRANLGNNWGIFAKLGISDNKAVFSGNDMSGSVGSTTTKQELVSGIGVVYAINQNISLRADLDIRKVELDVATNYGITGHVTSAKVGLQAAF